MAPLHDLVRWHQGHSFESLMNGQTDNVAKWRETAVVSQLQLLEDLQREGWLRKKPQRR